MPYSPCVQIHRTVRLLKGWCSQWWLYVYEAPYKQHSSPRSATKFPQQVELDLRGTTELSAMVEMSYACTVQYGSH